jgi:dihydrofolate synthase/folylpolyglutamate synthase
MIDSYQEALDYLYNQLPQYQTIGGKAYKASLDNIINLCEVLNHPQNKFKSVHIAGTNGKGSTSSLLASILTESGYKVGLFTSPHLIDFRERIVINGASIPELYVVNFVQKYEGTVESIAPSFFEWTTALAFDYFASENVDVAIIETGLGGRLDSSNIIKPLLSIITTIGIDHTQYLGNTLTAIAFEKGGIIKPNTPCVIGYGIEAEAKEELGRLAEQNNIKLTIAKELDQNFKCGLLGQIQQYNIATVFAALEFVKVQFSKINQHKIELGLQNVISNTLLRGRWEVLSNAPKVVADIAHNVQAVKVIVNQLENEKYNKLHIVWGMVEDKEIEKVVSLLPNNATYYLCQPEIKRAMKLTVLASFFKGRKFVECNSCIDAYYKAKASLTKNDFLLISGSNFVVSEVIQGLENNGDLSH